MKAALFYGKEDVRIEDIEEPPLRAGTVKIAPAFNGICGSDLHLYHAGPIPPAPTADTPHPLSGETLPVVMGHEFSGVVEALGDGVEGLAVGDSVVVEPLMVDGTCPACKAGKYNLCEQMGFIGISGRGGGLSEHIVVERRWVHPVGDLPLDHAAMIEPLAVALHSVKHAGAKAGQTAVIGGGGPIGLLVAAVLKAKGVATIVSEVSKARREKALSSGVADAVVDPAHEELRAVVHERTGGRGRRRRVRRRGRARCRRAIARLARPGRPARDRGDPHETGGAERHDTIDDEGRRPRQLDRLRERPRRSDRARTERQGRSRAVHHPPHSPR